MTFSSQAVRESGEEREKRKEKLPKTGEVKKRVTERTCKRKRETAKEDGGKREINGRESEVEACGGLWAGAGAASA